jgi:hypothetical protein
MEGIGSGFLGEISFLLNKVVFTTEARRTQRYSSIVFVRCLSNLPNEIFVAFISSA